MPPHNARRNHFMKTPLGIILALLLVTVSISTTWALVGTTPGTGGSTRHGTPGGPSLTPISAPVLYKDLMLIIATKEGIAAVVFGDEVEKGVNYRFRFLPADSDKEQAGEGKVFEKWESKTVTRNN